MVGHGEVQPEQADDEADQAFGLPERQAEDGAQGQRRQDRQGRVVGLSAPGCPWPGYPFLMPYAWSVASCRSLRRFPPRARPALHRAVLNEILEERVASSRGRQVLRGVKRKMSGYPLRPRTPMPAVRIDFVAAIRSQNERYWA